MDEISLFIQFCDILQHHVYNTHCQPCILRRADAAVLLTDVIVEAHQSAAELCAYNLTSVIGSSWVRLRCFSRTLITLHDHPYPGADTLVDEFCGMVSLPLLIHRMMLFADVKTWGDTHLEAKVGKSMGPP